MWCVGLRYINCDVVRRVEGYELTAMWCVGLRSAELGDVFSSISKSSDALP